MLILLVALGNNCSGACKGSRAYREAGKAGIHGDTEEDTEAGKECNSSLTSNGYNSCTLVLG
jgi:hypothetical protein